MKTKMLLVFAHPDDESFAAGGTIARYASQGWQIDVVCVTRGQRGGAGPYDETVDVGALRAQELEEAGKVLGVSSVQFFDYMDERLSTIHPGELEDKIHKVLLSLDPDIVITFEPNGISNNPDHKKVSISTTYAFQKYATTRVHGEKLGTRDPRRRFITAIPGSKRPAPKLFFACIPESVVLFLRKHDIIPDESFGKPWQGIADKKVTTCIDISRFTETKIKALSKYKTKMIDIERFVSIDNQPLVFKEYFILRFDGEQEIFMGNDDPVADEL